MSGLKYVDGRQGNSSSYQVFETLSWSTFGGAVNRWRLRVLGLPLIYAAEAGTNLVARAKIPFSAMWSPAFVPKPSDWPDQCEVVGTFTIDQKKDFDVTPFADLAAWLEAGDKPIFIGFGSMVIQDPKSLERTIQDAAKAAGRRVIVQSSWTKLNVEGNGSDLLRNVGPCPHDWLLPQCSAVVHHGGAGTVAAGLRYGLPTVRSNPSAPYELFKLTSCFQSQMVCPFFADQFMWGYFVELAGVGPKACPVIKLTTEKLVEAFRLLGSEEIKTAASKLAGEMGQEDGIEGGLVHFLDCLPRENMLCDVSLLLGETAIARYELIGSRVESNGIKVSTEVAAYLEADRKFNWFRFWPSAQRRLERRMYGKGMRRHSITSYNLAGCIRTFHHGCFSAFAALFCILAAMPFQLYLVSDRFARSHGAFGCLFGIVASVFCMVFESIRAVVVFFDRLIIAFTNGIFGKQYDAIIDWRRHSSVYDTPKISSEKESFLKNGIPKARGREIGRAIDMVAKARSVFEDCKPFFPKHHKHYTVVKLPKLLESLGLTESQALLRLTTREATEVAEALDCNSLPKRTSVRRFAMFPPKTQKGGNGSEPSSTQDPTSEPFDEDNNGSKETPPSPGKRIVHAEEKLEAASPEVLEDATRKDTFFRSLMAQLNSFTRKKPGETEISFTHFVLALHGVCAEKIFHETVRRTERPGEREDFSQYLS